MIIEASPADPSIAVKIHEVLQAAYTLEAERIGCASCPPLRETMEDLRASSDTFLVFHQGGQFIAVLSFASGTIPVTVTRVAVRPSHLRLGIGTSLFSEFAARAMPNASLAVSTAAANAPAVAFYQKLGFKALRLTTSPEGISLLHLTKAAKA
jgi:ribosomal protein S18 acetylase RimI-like enzyme